MKILSPLLGLIFLILPAKTFASGDFLWTSPMKIQISEAHGGYTPPYYLQVQATNLNCPNLKESYRIQLGSAELTIAVTHCNDYSDDFHVVTKSLQISEGGWDLPVPSGSLIVGDFLLVNFKSPTMVGFPSYFGTTPHRISLKTIRAEFTGTFLFNISQGDFSRSHSLPTFFTSIQGRENSIKILAEFPLVSDQGMFEPAYKSKHYQPQRQPFSDPGATRIIGVLPAGTIFRNINPYLSSYLLQGIVLSLHGSALCGGGGCAFEITTPSQILPPKPIELAFYKTFMKPTYIPTVVKQELMQKIEFIDLSYSYGYQSGRRSYPEDGDATVWVASVAGGTLAKSTEIKVAPSCVTKDSGTDLMLPYSHAEQYAWFREKTTVTLSHSSLNWYSIGNILEDINPFMVTSGTFDSSVRISDYTLHGHKNMKPWSCRKSLFFGTRYHAGEKYVSSSFRQ